jgi:hypothetical protein
VLQNRVSILAKSLIISFQHNFESVYFFYSNRVYVLANTGNLIVADVLTIIQGVRGTMEKSRMNTHNSRKIFYEHSLSEAWLPRYGLLIIQENVQNVMP